MDDVNFQKNHHNFQGSPGERLSAESLPLIDTRLLSQSELRALSQCYSLSSSSSPASLAASASRNDDLTLKIDRSFFNESASSRKQTFLRVRLAREPQPQPPQRKRDDSSREEKSQIASLLRSLFSIDSIQTKTEEDEGDEEHESKDKQPLIPSPINNVYPNPYFDPVQNVLVHGISENETTRRRGRPRKIQNPSDGGINGETKVSQFSSTGDGEESVSLDKTCSNFGIESRHDASGISMDSNSSRRKRGRPRKSGGGGGGEEKGEIVNFVNREGKMVDLTALANNADDLYGEELRRITMGLESKEAFFGFLEQMNGKWVSAGKKKKLVDASNYGGYLPRGWKLMLFVKKKGTDHFLACHRYISPGGQEFATCKEVSAYLQPLLESQSKNQLNSLQSDNKTREEEPVIANKSLVGSSNSVDLPVPSSETNQNIQNGRPISEVTEEAKGGTEERIPATDNLAALSNQPGGER